MFILIRNIQEEINARNAHERLQKGNLDFTATKVGLKTLDDATINLGNLKTSNNNLANNLINKWWW